jgi:hypothetical protein
MALRPSQQTAQSYNLPPSVGGINALDSLAAMPPTDCVTSHNLMPSEYGMRLRAGYREWANGMNGKPVNTLIAFEGQAADQASDRLWAVTEDGIWNVTDFGETTPVLEYDFSTLPAPSDPEGSGFGTYVEFTNDADARFLQYADEGYGLFQYDEAGQAWTIPLFDPPADPPLLAADIAFVTSWKNRLWYIKSNSGQAWYLEPDAQDGIATKQTFGSKMPHGGELLAIFSWTIDGGTGIDDYLVAVGRGGDIMVYQGYDPATVPTFEMKGIWFVGEFPESRRIGVDYGGELYLLSTYGVMSLRDLMQGVEITSTPTTPSSKINRFLRPAVEAGKDERNWALHTYPGDGFLQIVAPYDDSNLVNAIQYTQNLLTRSWGLWQNVPVNCATSWSGKYLMGDKQGRVWEYAGGTDGRLLDGSNTGASIGFDVLTSFQQPGGDHTTNKRIGFIRPITIETTPSTLNTAAVYDYRISTETQAPPAAPNEPTNAWDAADWDIATWDYILTSNSRTVGSLGMGNVAAISMRGSATNRITFVGFDISWTQGGFF